METATTDRRLEANPTDYEVFGEYERHTMPVDQYVMLPQVRPGLNPNFAVIKESIREVGILNRVDVARVSEATLGDYIMLVNGTWHTDVALEDYEHLRQPDDMFYVVIAGHTRTEALRQLKEEDQNSANPSENPYNMAVDIHPIKGTMDIIKLQMHENSYSAPPPERRAQGIVEAYKLGLRSEENPEGPWRTMKEFSEQTGISTGILGEALNFAKLPPEALDFVFSGELHYGASVELGKASDTIEEYERMKLGFDKKGENAENDAAAEEAYRLKLTWLITSIFGRGLGVGASQKFIRGQVGLMKKQLDQANGKEVQAEIALFDLGAETEMYIKSLKRELNELNAEIDRLSPENVRKFMYLQERLTDSSHALEQARQQAAQGIGSLATKELVAA